MARERRQQIAGTRAEVEAVIAEEDAEAGYPRKGRNVGRGPHAAMPDAWDGTGDCPPGWTKTWAVPEEHPRRAGEFRTPIRNRAHRMRLRGKRLAGRTFRDEDFKVADTSWRPLEEGELD